MLVYQGQQQIHCMATCAVCSDCKHSTLFAHMNTFVYLDVSELSVLEGLLLSDCLFIKSLLSDNLVAWQHE